MAPDMHLVAWSFLNVATATAARTMLTRDFDLVSDLLVSRVGDSRRLDPNGGLLVGRFHSDVLDAVRAAVADAGGTVEVDLLDDRRLENS
jgi:hypothetical protein